MRPKLRKNNKTGVLRYAGRLYLFCLHPQRGKLLRSVAVAQLLRSQLHRKIVLRMALDNEIPAAVTLQRQQLREKAGREEIRISAPSLVRGSGDLLRRAEPCSAMRCTESRRRSG